MKHKCPICFYEIVNSRKDAIYCSRACKQASYRIRKDKLESTKKGVTEVKRE